MYMLRTWDEVQRAKKKPSTPPFGLSGCCIRQVYASFEPERVSRSPIHTVVSKLRNRTMHVDIHDKIQTSICRHTYMMAEISNLLHLCTSHLAGGLRAAAGLVS